MKFVVDVPDWALGRHLYLFAGIELVAMKMYGEDQMWIKTDRCSMCGKCCGGFQKWYFPQDENGICTCLKEEEDGKQGCNLGVARPFYCAVADGQEKNSDCTVRYMKINIPDLTCGKETIMEEKSKEKTNTILQVDDGVIGPQSDHLDMAPKGPVDSLTNTLTKVEVKNG